MSLKETRWSRYIYQKKQNQEFKYSLTVQENKIIIGLEKDDTDLKNTLTNLFGSKYINFKIEGTVSKKSFATTTPIRPLVGGLSISTFAPCSGAFSVKNSSGYFYVTAGHCIPQNSAPLNVIQGDSTIGQITSTLPYNGYWTGREVDVAAIPINTADKSYMEYDGNIIDDEELNPIYGQIVCISGAASGKACGTVTNVGGGYSDGNGIWLKNQLFYSVMGTHGDSGGLVYVNGASTGHIKAVGVVHGAYVDRGTATQIINITNFLKGSLVTAKNP
ncbi:hypothetical protein [Paenibacillus sp. OAS669]|uniref:hypothetical protein n=1 Tax=Paenibacillus sp. OAS669 TaxID=2663821 RepID=UPI00178C0EC9|nr:hypothetical protein [Paenibacillus sp. OAS669]MBE1444246.1 hypothetical protein [Paenibacillus sp. OAS669]